MLGMLTSSEEPLQVPEVVERGMAKVGSERVGQEEKEEEEREGWDCAAVGSVFIGTAAFCAVTCGEVSSVITCVIE